VEGDPGAVLHGPGLGDQAGDLDRVTLAQARRVAGHLDGQDLGRPIGQGDQLHQVQRLAVLVRPGPLGHQDPAGAARQHGELIQIEATARGRPVEEGGYLWRGELRLWDNEILLGWYAASDGSVRSKGTMYFVMHPHGVSATGRWVGLSYDGTIVTGWSSMARTEADARELVGELKEQDAPSS
jgi:hypothetical protein